jgi:hypothetical protein
MKLLPAIVIAVILLAVMAPIALVAGASDSGPVVYVSVSVDKQLLVAAQPITYTEGMSLDDVMKATHEEFYSGGLSGYTAGIDPMWNMYLISKCWGITATPYIILNDAPLGATSPQTVDTTYVVANDNVIICTGSDMMNNPISPVSLKSTLSGDSATVTATAWTLDFMTFTYSHVPLAGANVIDPTTSASLGTTDDSGSITVTVPESGIVAIEGMAAINVTAIPAAGGAATVPEGTISYKDAKSHIGETVTIQDKVYEKVDDSADSMWVLFFGGPSTDPDAVGIEVKYSDLSKFPSDLYVGKTIIITGELHANPVGGASFSLTDPSQVQEVSGAPATATTSAAPAAPDIPLFYGSTISLIIVAIVILTPIAVIVIVKMVRQSRLDKPSVIPTSPFAAPASASGAPASAFAAPASTSGAPAPKSTSGSGITVYVSVSVDGQLLVAAKPVTITDMTIQGAMKAAHEAYYSAGKSGYTAGIDKTFNMYLVTKCWGIQGTPYVILNGAPLGATAPQTVDITPVAANDNVIICISSDPMNRPAKPVSLTATVSGNSASVTATSWTLNFSTFQYSSAPLANMNVIDPATGASLGTTDADGHITVTVPGSGVVAIGGLAAIAVASKRRQSKGNQG